MLKETTKHRRILYFTATFMLFGYFGLAQKGTDDFSKIKGTYCDRGQGYTNCITFISDSLFDYSLNNYVGNGYQETGKGTYKKENGSLILKFCYADSLKISFHRIEITKCKTGDSLLMKFLIQDAYSNDQIPFSGIVITDSLHFSKTIKTDFEGIAQANIPKSINSLFISINYVGFEKYSFKTSLSDCQKTNVKLRNFGKIVPDGAIMTYEINKIRPSELQLKKDGRDIIFKKER